MKKILFYINTIHKGGAERVLVQLTRHFSEAGWNVLLVTSYVTDNEYQVSNNVNRVVLEKEDLNQSKIKRNISRIQKLRKLCMNEKPDAVISFMQEPNLRAVIATIGLPTKCVVSVRNDPSKEYSGVIGKVVGKLVLPMANGCVFQTEDAKKWFPKRLQRKSAIIQNEVDRVFFETERLPEENVVAVGRLSEQKNHKLLINSFAKIAVRHPKTNLLIYGEGTQQDSLQAEIERLQMKDRILLMGITNDVPNVLSKAKTFALSSDYEGMPNCLLEALAIGVPCVSTDCPCGGPKSLIRNEENGLLVPVGDENAMAIALDRLLSDQEFAKELGKNAKNSAMRFQPDTVFLQWKHFVEDVIDS